MLFPINYRHTRSNRLTSLTCVAAWLCVVAVSLPYELTERLPELDQAGCYPLRRRSLAMSWIGEGLLYTVPLLATYVCYAIVACKMWTRGALVIGGETGRLGILLLHE